MISPKELSFNFNGFRYAAQQWGSEGVHALAIHGWLDNSNSFAVLGSQLTDVTLVAPDMAGHGHSDHRNGFSDYPIWSEVTECFAMADALGWQRFALVGHSRGAMMAFLAAATFPERISHLVFIDALVPPPVSADQAPERIVKNIQETHRRIQRKRSCYPSYDVALQARCNSEFGPVTYDSAKLLAERGLIEVDEGFHWHADGKLWASSKVALTAEQIRAFAQQISAKTLLLIARQGFKPRVKSGSDFDQLMDFVIKQLNANVKEFDDGHFLHMETAATDVALTIQEFLQL